MDEQDDFGDENHDQGPIVNKNPYLLISAFSTGKINYAKVFILQTMHQ